MLMLFFFLLLELLLELLEIRGSGVQMLLRSFFLFFFLGNESFLLFVRRCNCEAELEGSRNGRKSK